VFARQVFLLQLFLGTHMKVQIKNQSSPFVQSLELSVRAGGFKKIRFQINFSTMNLGREWWVSITKSALISVG